MDLDLRRVRAFVAAADHRHIGRAAAALFLTQQAMSKRLARLEDDIGILFERGPTGVTLTPTGERFLPAARHLLEVADHAAATARADHTPGAARRHLGTVRSAGVRRADLHRRASPRGSRRDMTANHGGEAATRRQPREERRRGPALAPSEGAQQQNPGEGKSDLRRPPAGVAAGDDAAQQCEQAKHDQG